MTAYFKKVTKGFTLIELLIVMAILGVLAVVVLVAINPVQQLARTRDAGRKSGVTQIGHALEAYYTSRNGVYLTEAAVWLQDIVDAGELAVVPSGITDSAGPVACANQVVGTPATWCYDYDAVNGNIIAYARLESNPERSKCGAIVNNTNPSAWFVFSSADGRGGLVCNTGAAEPAAGTQTWTD